MSYLSGEVVDLTNCRSVTRQDAWNGRVEPQLQAEEEKAWSEAALSGGGGLVETVLAARAPEGCAARRAVVEASAKRSLPQLHLSPSLTWHSHYGRHGLCFLGFHSFSSTPSKSTSVSFSFLRLLVPNFPSQPGPKKM